MTENLFTVVEHFKGVEFIRENKTNYLIPIGSIKAMCILLNYVARNGTLPNVDTAHWYDSEEFEEYYEKELSE